MGYRRYRKLFIISCEGKETEIQYFRLIQSYNPEILVDCPTRNRQSSPFQVLKTLKQRIMEKNPRPPYEAWLVIDKDHWTGVQIDELAKWVDHHGNRGLAVSNPKFEFWLLLHFEMGNDVHTSRECTIRLQRYLDDFSKHIDPRAITLFGIEAAIQHAKLRDNPPCSDWPHDSGSTTVYRLVERMIVDEG